jgi:hypothetical protein
MAVTNLKIKKELPPNYLDIAKVFTDLDLDNTLFCYGDTIYNPGGKDITPDLEIHEDTHRVQQGTAPDLWWDKYLTDPLFRLDQEVEAYSAQYQFARKAINEIKGGSKMKKWALENMSKALSSKMYGNILTYHEAESRIRNYGRDIA